MLKLCGKKHFTSNSVKYLGVILDEHLRWNFHISQLCMKLIKALQQNNNFWKCDIWGTDYLNLFVLLISDILFSRFQVFEFLTIPWLAKSVRYYYYMRQGASLYISFETQLIKATKLGQLIDMNNNNNFQESFKQFKRLGLSSRSFWI